MQNSGKEVLRKECGRSIACSNRSHTLPECVTAFSILGLGVPGLSDARSKRSNHDGGRVKRSEGECSKLLLRG
jgi:hypothetical protein